jgi:hypothetical protein
VTPEAIRIAFAVETTGGIPDLKYGIRVFRTEQGSTAAPARIGPDALLPAIGGNLSVEDHSFEWEKRYVYRLAVVTAVLRAGQPIAEVEGDDSGPVTVFAHDIFPPAVPSGVQAVYSGVAQKPFVDLTWAPNTDADLAGYNVYRREASGPPVKSNAELVKTPAYRDAEVAPAHHYAYAVTAVDLRGNESAKSTETTEAVP